MGLPPDEIRRRIANMDRHLDDAYHTGSLTTTKYSVPVTNREKLAAYYAQRDEYARQVGVPELGPDAHDARMASREIARKERKAKRSGNGHTNVTSGGNGNGTDNRQLQYRPDADQKYINSTHARKRPSRWV